MASAYEGSRHRPVPWSELNIVSRWQNQTNSVRLCWYHDTNHQLSLSTQSLNLSSASAHESVTSVVNSQSRALKQRNVSVTYVTLIPWRREGRHHVGTYQWIRILPESRCWWPSIQQWHSNCGDGKWRICSLLQGMRVTYVTKTFPFSRTRFMSRRNVPTKCHYFFPLPAPLVSHLIPPHILGQKIGQGLCVESL